MKFTKINDNSIRCIISREEMSAQGINLDELMDDRGKAEEFLRYILQQARYELNFVTTGEALNVQLTVMKDGDVSLMISDDQNAAIHAMLAQFKERLKEFQEAIEQGRRQNAKEALSVDPSKGTFFADGSDDDMIQMEIWAELESLDHCIRLAKSYTWSETPSSLLKYRDTYYLVVQLNQSKKQLAHSVFAIAEFSNNLYSSGPATYGIEEHAVRMIPDNALQQLQKL